MKVVDHQNATKMWNDDIESKGQVNFMNQCWSCTNLEELESLFKKEEKTCVDEKERKETEAMYLDMKGQKLKIVRSKT